MSDPRRGDAGTGPGASPRGEGGPQPPPPRPSRDRAPDRVDAAGPGRSADTGSRSRSGFAAIGLRGETVVVLPLATALVVLLSLAAVLAYRSAVHQFIEAEHERILAASREHLELVLAPGAAPPTTLTRPPGAAAIARLDADGIATASSEGLEGVNLLDPLRRRRGEPVAAPIVRGPDGTLGPIVAAVLAAPGAAPGAATGPLYRIDWPAPVLARHRRRLPILATTVVLADAALLTLVLLYRRRRLRPIEGLIERARSVQSAQAAAGDGATRQRVDEVAQLLETFDRALGELARRGSEADPLSEAVRDSGGAGDGAEDGETSTGLLLVDAGGRFLALNEAGAHWLDVGIDVAGRAVEEVLERQPEVAAILEQALRTGQPVRRHECGVRTASGERRILGLTLTRLTRADGSPRGWLGLFTDLTHVQREHRESMLSTSLAQIAEMSAGLAHELRNGMASLRGYATLLARSDLGPRQAEDLAELQQEIDHLHRVAEDFLSFARPGTARLEDLDLVEVTRRAVADPALRGERVELELAGGGDGGTAAGELAVADEGPSTTPRTALRGDAQLIERLLRNLMSNAARSHRDLEPRPPIVVRVFAEPDEGDPRSSRPTVEVLDRGPGLPEAVRERLFTPFARGNEDGVGLGLALARRIADLHHAELTLEPRAGGGTRARLRFPPPAGSVG